MERVPCSFVTVANAARASTDFSSFYMMKNQFEIILFSMQLFEECRRRLKKITRERYCKDLLFDNMQMFGTSHATKPRNLL